MKHRAPRDCENSKLLIWIHFVIVALCIGAMGASYAAWWSVPEGIGNFLSLIVGFSAKALADATSFEFGSSRSSQKKDATIATLTLQQK